MAALAAFAAAMALGCTRRPAADAKPVEPDAAAPAGAAAVKEDVDAPGLAGPAFSGAADASAEWPSSREGLVFMFGTAKDPGLVFDGGDEPAQLWVGYRGFTRRDHDYAMLVQNGSFFFDELAGRLLAALGGSMAFTIEMFLTPGNLEQGPADILSFAGEGGAVNLRIAQEGPEIVAELRARAGGGKAARLRLCRLREAGPGALAPDVGPARGAGPCHLVVSCSTYASSVLTCYANGVKTAERNDASGAPSAWEDLPLHFGSAADRSRPWAGAMEGVAIWRRALGGEEARAGFERYSARVAARRRVPRLEVRARLLTRSDTPEAKRIAPYTRALAVFRYAVDEVVSGECGAKEVRVAHWTMFERKHIPMKERPVGGSYRLVLERMEDNPQLESEWLADDGYDPDVTLYYDTSAPALAEGE